MRVLKLKYFSRKIFCSDNEDYIPLNSVFKLPVVENLTELCVRLDGPGNYFNIDVLLMFLLGNEISISSIELIPSKEKPRSSSAHQIFVHFNVQTNAIF